MGQTGELQSVEEKIISCALKVIANKTIGGTRIHLVAEEAGMRPSNIHYYFKTKEDLLKAVLEEIQQRSSSRRQQLTRSAGDTLKEQLLVFFDSKQRMIEQDQQSDIVQIDFWLQGMGDNAQMKTQFQTFFEVWRDDIFAVLDRYIPDLCDAKKKNLTYIMVSMMIGTSMQYHYEPDELKLSEYFSTCLDMILGIIDSYRKSPEQPALQPG